MIRLVRSKTLDGLRQQADSVPVLEARLAGWQQLAGAARLSEQAAVARAFEAGAAATVAKAEADQARDAADAVSESLFVKLADIRLAEIRANPVEAGGVERIQGKLALTVVRGVLDRQAAEGDEQARRSAMLLGTLFGFDLKQDDPAAEAAEAGG